MNMITEKDLYWLTRLDGIRDALHGVCFVFGILSVVVVWGWIAFYIGAVSEYSFSEWYEGVKNKIKVFIGISSLVLGLFTCTWIAIVLVPSTKEAAFIYLTPKIVNSTFVQELPKDALDIKTLAMDYVKEKLKDKEE